MLLIFRVDGGYSMGMGHISRCISLAKYIRSKFSVKIVFVTRDFKPSINWIKKEGFKFHTLAQEIDFITDARIMAGFLKNDGVVVITDLPGLKEKYLLTLVKNKSKFKIVCLDSFGLNESVADAIVNPSIVRKWHPLGGYKYNTRYLGPDYWILDSAFRLYHTKKKKINKKVKNVLISLGGSQTGNNISRVISSLLKFREGLKITVIIGPAFKGFKVPKGCRNNKIVIKRNIRNLARLIFEADVGIVSAGFTLYEAACLGLPCLMMNKVAHQLETARRFEELGIAKLIGPLGEFKKSTLKKEFERVAASETLRQKMSRNGKELVDGRGTQRVWHIIKNSLRKL
ncbi:MAG: hypothetical protein V1674_07870 [Candidatus Omnitrophota bacterium]